MRKNWMENEEKRRMRKTSAQMEECRTIGSSQHVNTECSKTGWKIKLVEIKKKEGENEERKKMSYCEKKSF